MMWDVIGTLLSPEPLGSSASSLLARPPGFCDFRHGLAGAEGATVAVPVGHQGGSEESCSQGGQMDNVRTVDHQAGTTSLPERANHVIAAQLLAFDLAEEQRQLRQEYPYQEGDRNAKTLVKSGRYRLVLATPKAGARFRESDPEGYVSLLVQHGRIAVEVEGQTSELGSDQIAAIEAGYRWSATTLDDSVVLMNFSWPEA
jgi:hypothetical protein